MPTTMFLGADPFAVHGLPPASTAFTLQGGDAPHVVVLGGPLLDPDYWFTYPAPTTDWPDVIAWFTDACDLHGIDIRIDTFTNDSLRGFIGLPACTCGQPDVPFNTTCRSCGTTHLLANHPEPF